jgi:hypothetical protein
MNEKSSKILNQINHLNHQEFELSNIQKPDQTRKI